MTITVFIFFLLGLLIELLWLYDAAHPETQPDWSRFIAPLGQTRPTQTLAALFLLTALTIVGLLRLTGFDSIRVSLDDNWVGAIFVSLGLFLLAAGLVADLLVPRVNESIILGVLLMGLFDGLLRPPETWSPMMFVLGGVQVLCALFLAIYRQPLSLTGRALVYLVYLFTLFFQAFSRPHTVALFTGTNLSWQDAFLFGAVFVFLMLHGLLFLRFLLIVSSLILPANRPLLRYIIPHLYRDDQANLWQVAAVCALLTALFALNRATGLLTDSLLVSFSLAAGVQTLLKPGFWKRS